MNRNLSPSGLRVSIVLAVLVILAVAAWIGVNAAGYTGAVSLLPGFEVAEPAVTAG